MNGIFLRLAWRNIWRNQRRSLILVGAILIGAAGLSFSLGFMNAYLIQMTSNAIDYDLGYIQVHASGYHDNPTPDRTFTIEDQVVRELADRADVTGLSRRLRTTGLASNPRYSRGIQIVGVDPRREGDVSLVPGRMIEGRYLEPADRNGVVIGRAFADKLKTRLGRKLILMCSDRSGQVASEAFTIVGMYEGPQTEFEKNYVYVSLSAAQRLLAVGEAISDLVFRLSPEDDPDQVAAALRTFLSGRGLEVMTWMEMEPLLVQMTVLFSQSSFLLFLIIFIAMAFVIANSFLMAVMERIREFGLMKAMGVRPRQLVSLILLESFMLAFIGNGLGLAIGGALTRYF
ncbi:ABC transporter permease, partial [bacterium]|nr:ABC transporter permease [candidate division CSSED10-310 bacterium]